MRTSPSEIAISAARAGKTMQKLLKTSRQKPRTILKPPHPRSREAVDQTFLHTMTRHSFVIYVTSRKSHPSVNGVFNGRTTGAAS